MVQSILLRVIPLFYLFCAVVHSSADSEIFSTSIPTDEACTLYNTRYPVDSELKKALEGFYGKEPIAITYTAFDESDDEKTLSEELTKATLDAGIFVPVIIYSPLEGSAFRPGTPYAN